MDGKLRKTLTECIRDIETGTRDVEGCLQQHPDRAAELRPHLELWSDLNAAPKAQPNFGSQQRGQQQLLGALADMEKEREGRTTRFLTPALVKAAAVVVGVALLAGGAAGASEAFGGPDVGGQILSTFGLDNAREHAAERAKEEGRGLDTADIAVENGGVVGLDIALDRAADQAKSSIEAAGEAPSQAQGAGNSTSQGSGPPESAPAADSVPPEANVPDFVPAGPTQ